MKENKKLKRSIYIIKNINSGEKFSKKEYWHYKARQWIEYRVL